MMADQRKVEKRMPKVTPALARKWLAGGEPPAEADEEEEDGDLEQRAALAMGGVQKRLKKYREAKRELKAVLAKLQ
jgi:hypothetical protein